MSEDNYWYPKDGSSPPVLVETSETREQRHLELVAATLLIPRLVVERRPPTPTMLQDGLKWARGLIEEARNKEP